MPRHGGCMCGAVRYTVTGEPIAVSVCHCTSCRKAVGATPVAWVILSRTDFEVSGDALSSYSSSEGVRRTFCGICGTSITFEVEDSPDTVDVTLATFDEPQDFEVERHIWVGDRVIRAASELPHYDRDPL